MNTNRKIVLITGGTGRLGTPLINNLSKDYEKIIVLTRNTNLKGKNNKISFLNADITKENLGLNSNVYSQLTSNITEIIHMAANTSFTASYQKAALVNIKGTKNILGLAKKTRNLRKFIHFSTAFISGEREGDIFEEGLEHNAGFVNNYELTKYQSELIAREHFSQLPISVIRPVLILTNDSKNIFNVMLDKIKQSKFFIITGCPVTNLHLIPLNSFVKRVSSSLNDLQSGKAYHFANKPDQLMTLRELVAFVEKLMNKKIMIINHKIQLGKLYNLTGQLFHSKTFFSEDKNNYLGGKKQIFSHIEEYLK
ncbi:MAG: SDR family oxidoreductase [Patescibacteria group bacterium]